jgi:hypothetical protein
MLHVYIFFSKNKAWRLHCICVCLYVCVSRCLSLYLCMYVYVYISPAQRGRGVEQLTDI